MKYTVYHYHERIHIHRLHLHRVKSTLDVNRNSALLLEDYLLSPVIILFNNNNGSRGYGWMTKPELNKIDFWSNEHIYRIIQVDNKIIFRSNKHIYTVIQVRKKQLTLHSLLPPTSMPHCHNLLLSMDDCIADNRPLSCTNVQNKCEYRLLSIEHFRSMMLPNSYI